MTLCSRLSQAPGRVTADPARCPAFWLGTSLEYCVNLSVRIQEREKKKSKAEVEVEVR